ncbi:low molecular weight phosphatase family protein [Streptomyces sp. NK08204]|uniref:arsenate-mycothiol transferase ArsC n=1 Tax=Streptomyces sp. NK08204 TaxID=2873260 RepID=UPI001CEC8A9A|nr:hypothetical protein [Streptomyces sp. NK08204]
MTAVPCIQPFRGQVLGRHRQGKRLIIDSSGAPRRARPRPHPIAATVLAHRAGGHVVVSSTGTHPTSQVEPVVAQVPAAAGADFTDAFPEPLTDEMVQAADIVIARGCGDACPIVSGRRHPDWPVTDHEGAPIAVAGDIRDEIGARITEPLTSLPST